MGHNEISFNLVTYTEKRTNKIYKKWRQGRGHRIGSPDCLLKTHPHARSKDVVCGEKPARCQYYNEGSVTATDGTVD